MALWFGVRNISRAPVEVFEGDVINAWLTVKVERAEANAATIRHP